MNSKSARRDAANDAANDAADSQAEIAALLCDERAAVREAAARRAARSQSNRHLRALNELARCDPSQRVRREAAAAIGRIAADLPEAFGALAGLAEHSDPGVVLQAARGLARAARAARATPDCSQQAVALPILDRLAGHPNEVVREFVAVERSRGSRRHKASAGGGGGIRTARSRPGSRTG